MAKIERKVAYIKRAKSGGKASQQKKAIWVYKPLKLPYRPNHLTEKQIKDAVDQVVEAV
ncbi:hypothetical protein [Aquabacterium humicola]|uniref:hypothetical protein n=1 Tax=Aquabacterium humicola TaxID=3237377 RepID=UPI002543B22B|nr:hypothetical protein [Rubrivivax pictus]